MTPAQIRDANFVHLRSGLPERCAVVLADLAAYGPCTTRELAARSGRDILAVRPRVTDLGQMGLVVLDGRTGGEGIYRVAGETEWDRWRASFCSGQQQLL